MLTALKTIKQFQVIKHFETGSKFKVSGIDWAGHFAKLACPAYWNKEWVSYGPGFLVEGFDLHGDCRRCCDTDYRACCACFLRIFLS